MVNYFCGKECFAFVSPSPRYSLARTSYNYVGHYDATWMLSFSITNSHKGRSQRRRRIVRRHLAHHGDGPDLSETYIDIKTDVRNLLTQRSIQTFLYLANAYEPQSRKWVEDFLDIPKNQCQHYYHGTHASYMSRFGDEWEGPLLAMINHPPIQGVDGIDLVSLVSTILSIREQLAEEWHMDLYVLKEANERILDSYIDFSKKERKKKDEELLSSPPYVFERTMPKLIKEKGAEFNQSTGSSPFRYGNFDLLYNLCTQASIHYLLKDVQTSVGTSKKNVSFEWLHEFYKDRVSEYFDGNQKYDRADDFMDDLLRSSPSIVVNTDEEEAGSEGKRSVFVDPMGLAEQIIGIRSQILQEWMYIMPNIPEHHNCDIRPILLNRQMAAWGSNQNSTTTIDEGDSPESDSFQ